MGPRIPKSGPFKSVEEYRVQGSGTTSRVEMNAKLIYVKENTCVRPVIESGLLEELIDQFRDLLRRVFMAVVANAL